MPQLCTAALSVKSHDPVSLALSQTVTQWLIRQGVQVVPLRLKDAVPPADLALCVGGDGSLISVARKLAGHNIPLLGINTGRVGFLPELTAKTWQEGLEPVLRQGWEVEKRLGISLSILRAGKEIFSSLAVNDVVLARSGLARLPAFTLEIGASRLITLRADGIIIASPTGSTAYSSSSGGPLIHPSLRAYSVTAICPFQTRLHPLVLEAETPLQVTLRESGTETNVTVDGQEFFPLREGDILRLCGRPDAILLARLKSHAADNYFEKLRAAGFIADSPGME